MMRWTLSLIAAGTVLVGLFHNCAGVRLQMPSYATMAPSSASSDLRLCVPAGYELASFYARNMNAVMSGGYLIPDTDADGLDDGTELSLGSKRDVRRSDGTLLDGVCLDTTANFKCTPDKLPIVCGPAELQETALRLNKCDLTMLGLDKVAAPPTLGLDSDHDDIPDVFEILGGSRPGIADAEADPDGDQVINRVEYQLGTNPRQSDRSANAASLIHLDLQKAASPDPGCSGQTWFVSIQQLPLIMVPEFTDSDYSSSANPPQIPLTHKKDENVLAFVAKLRPVSAAPGATGMLLYSYAKQSYLPNTLGRPIILEMDFTKAGDLLP